MVMEPTLNKYKQKFWYQDNIPHTIISDIYTWKQNNNTLYI